MKNLFILNKIKAININVLLVITCFITLIVFSNKSVYANNYYVPKNNAKTNVTFLYCSDKKIKTDNGLLVIKTCKATNGKDYLVE